MPTPRYNLTAAYSNGKIYAFGGYYFGPRNTVEAYDPANNSWSTVAPMPTARHNCSAVTVSNGRIFVIGGDTGGGGENVAIVEIYDPATNSWSTGPSMPNTKSGFGAALGLDGRIYAVGGGQSGIRVASLFVLDPNSNVWTVKSPMSLARSHPEFARLLDGRLVAVGGEDDSPGQVVNSVEIYDPGSDSWSQGTSMPTARAGLGASTGLDGRIYAVGGWVPIPNSALELSVNEAYVPMVVPQYQICSLYDQTKAVKSGSTLPIKIQLCDTNSSNLSSPGIIVHATSLTKISTSVSTEIQDSGNANPDSDFRYDAILGGTGGYIFNLKTTGLSGGTYRLSFSVGASTASYGVQFQVK